jgi:hypothetical protein
VFEFLVAARDQYIDVWVACPAASSLVVDGFALFDLGVHDLEIVCVALIFVGLHEYLSCHGLSSSYLFSLQLPCLTFLIWVVALIQDHNDRRVKNGVWR